MGTPFKLRIDTWERHADTTQLRKSILKLCGENSMRRGTKLELNGNTLELRKTTTELHKTTLKLHKDWWHSTWTQLTCVNQFLSSAEQVRSAEEQNHNSDKTLFRSAIPLCSSTKPLWSSVETPESSVRLKLRFTVQFGASPRNFVAPWYKSGTPRRNIRTPQNLFRTLQNLFELTYYD